MGQKWSSLPYKALKEGTVHFLERDYRRALDKFHSGLNAVEWKATDDPCISALLQNARYSKQLYDAFESSPTVHELLWHGLYEEVFEKLKEVIFLDHDKRVQHAYIKAGVHALYPYEKAGKWGYESPKDTREVGPIFEDAHGFEGGLGIVHDGDGWTVIDRSFEPITDLHFEKVAFTTEDGVSLVELDGLRNLLLPSGELFLSEWMEDVHPYGESGLYRVRKGGLYGFVDTGGSWVVEPRFKMAGNFQEGLAWASEEKLTGFLDPSGDFAIGPRFMDTTGFHEGLAGVRMEEEDHWAFCDRGGGLVCSPLFEQVGRFYDGHCGVQKEGAWGSIDKELRQHVPNVYDHVMSVGGGLHSCHIGRETCLVNRSGVILEERVGNEGYERVRVGV